MADLLLKAIDATNSDPETDRRGCYKAGMVVEVREDGAPRGTSEKWPQFAWIRIPGIAADVVRKYMEPQYAGIPTEQPEVYRRRRWQLRWSELPLAVRNKFTAKGEIVIKVGAYPGAYDYTWSQVKGYFRDMQTGLDETGEL